MLLDLLIHRDDDLGVLSHSPIHSVRLRDLLRFLPTLLEPKNPLLRGFLNNQPSLIVCVYDF